jgi:hypothetical protein
MYVVEHMSAEILDSIVENIDVINLSEDLHVIEKDNTSDEFNRDNCHGSTY